MTATIEQARDDMIQLVNDAWPVGTVLIFDGFKGDKPNGAVTWGRVTVRHNGGGQSTISRQNQKSRYTRTGTLYVNMFSPPGDGLRKLDPLTKIVLDAIEGKTTPHGVWFTKVRVRELGIVEGYEQVNVLADFSYDEVK